MSNEMTEFRITSDLSALRGAVIDANFDEVKAWLDENLEPYRTMEVTPDAIQVAKTYRANIRKVKDRIDQSRKEAKNAALSAYTVFETKCKTLTGLCDEAANSLDLQIRVFEDAEKKEKVDKLRDEYESMTDEEVRDYLPWGVVNDPKWQNKSYSFETAVGEIRDAIVKTRSELESVRAMGQRDTPYLLDVYRQTRDLSAVVRKMNEIRATREREEQRQREEEARKAAAEKEFRRMAEEERKEREKTTYAPAVTTDLKQDELVTVSFKVTCTKAQLTALGSYMRESGIRYGKC